MTRDAQVTLLDALADSLDVGCGSADEQPTTGGFTADPRCRTGRRVNRARPDTTLHLIA